MKKVLPVLVCCFAVSAATAQYSGSISYAMSVPGGEMAKNIGLLHSAKLNIGRQLPGAMKRVQMGAELGIGTYAQITKEQTFVFGNGTSTRTNVNYGSNVFQAGAYTQIDLLQNKKIIPYLRANAGIAKFYSNVTVYDPKDLDGCLPMDKKSIVRDNVFTAGYGAGVRMDMKLIAPICGANSNWIDFSITRITGGNVDYINTKRIKDHYHNAADTDPKATPVVQRFINATTQNIHEHQVAELFTSKLRMLEFRVGYTISF